MPTTLTLAVTEDGLYLPRHLFPREGEVEVIGREDYILIRPAPSPGAGAGPSLSAREALRAAGLAVALDWPAPKPVGEAERGRLARKLGGGRLLSEEILELRQDRA